MTVAAPHSPEAGIDDRISREDVPRREPRVLIVAKDAGLRFGGESARPFHYFRVMRERGVDVRLLAHARTRDELRELLPHEFDRMHFAPDTRFHRFIARRGKWLPGTMRYMLFDTPSILLTQFIQRRMTRELVRKFDIDLVHQPIPISPKAPSMIHDVGAPVVIGPLNGDMFYPPGLSYLNARFERRIYQVARAIGNLANRLIPGKLKANTIIVSNQRTARGLPRGVRGHIVELVANAVDLRNWQPSPRVPRRDGPVRFVFLGRLEKFKCVDLLLEAFAKVVTQCDATLEIIGDGVERPRLERQARDLGLADRVLFPGFLSQPTSAERLNESDVFVFPSLRECGGAVVAEAMAMGLPVIASNWGGPADYASTECALFIDPTSREAFVQGFTDAMLQLAKDPALRDRLGRAARDRALTLFNWESRVDGLMDIYQQVMRPAPRG